jgi:4-carboxymuconolactone decarboxylase
VSARVAPLPRDEWGEDVRAALRTAYSEQVAERYFSDSAPMPNVLGTLMRHPALAGPFLSYTNVLLFRGALAPRTRELVVLRIAWLTRSVYEWLQHVRLASELGVTRDEIEAITRGPHDSVWSAPDTHVLAAADQLANAYRIDEATWSRLAEHFDERQLVELVFVAGTYAGLAMAFNSFGLELDTELATIAANYPLPEE